jgi:folate-binding protein YgfZ
MSVADEVLAVRRTAGVFRLSGRALLEVRGTDRVRFLQGQLSNDVAKLDPSGPHSGCYALALTREGRVVADFHVVARPDSVWLETAAAALPAAIARLEKFVIADDVQIADRSTAIARFAVEGPRARELVEAAAGTALQVEAEGAAPIQIGGVEAVVVAWGSSGDVALQIFVASEYAIAVEAALRGAADSCGAIFASEAALEVLRVEAGEPRWGAELGEHTLPAELRLIDRAISFTKGCYTGQEVVARMQSRGRVGHLLVGVALEGDALPEAGTAIEANGARVGELTSVARSPNAGTIALGFVRKGFDEPATALEVDGRVARVVALPFVAPATPWS